MSWISRINRLRQDSRRSAQPTGHDHTRHDQSLFGPAIGNSATSSINYSSGPASPSNISCSSGCFSHTDSPYHSANSLHEFLPFADAVDPRFSSARGNTSVGVDHLEVAPRPRSSNLARIEMLQNSLENPNLLPNVRRVLEAALRKFERTEQVEQELLPQYSVDVRPPYTK